MSLLLQSLQDQTSFSQSFTHESRCSRPSANQLSFKLSHVEDSFVYWCTKPHAVTSINTAFPSPMITDLWTVVPGGRFAKCMVCHVETTRNKMQRHLKEVHSVGLLIYKCPACDKAFKRKYKYEKHIQTCTGPLMPPLPQTPTAAAALPPPPPPVQVGPPPNSSSLDTSN